MAGGGCLADDMEYEAQSCILPEDEDEESGGERKGLYWKKYKGEGRLIVFSLHPQLYKKNINSSATLLCKPSLASSMLLKRVRCKSLS